MSNAHWKNYLIVILNIAMNPYNVNIVLTVVHVGPSKSMNLVSISVYGRNSRSQIIDS